MDAAVDRRPLAKFMLKRSKSSLDLVQATLNSMRPPESEVSSTACSSSGSANGDAVPVAPSAAPVAPSQAPGWFVENPGVTSPDDDQCADQAGEADGLVPLGDGTFFRAPGCNVPLGANIPLASWIEQETSAENLVSHKLNPCLI